MKSYPLSPLSDLFNSLHTLHDFIAPRSQGYSFSSGPGRFNSRMRMNAYENDSSWVFRFEMPGVKKEDLQITLENKSLTVNARVNHTPVQDSKTLWQESSSCELERTLSLPEDAVDDVQQVQAKLADGILNITIPKKAPTAPEQKIITVQVD